MPVMTRPASSRLAALVAGAALTGCMPAGASEQAREVSGLYTLFMVAAAAVFVIVTGLIGWTLWRHRRAMTGELPPQTHGNLRIEAVWWALPSLLAFVLFGFSAAVLASVDEEAPDPLIVHVQAYQWQWRFTYEASDVVIDGTPEQEPQIVLPVDTPIAFLIESRDVIHSFYIPAFIVKRDAVPGRQNRIDVTITDAGTYSGQCGEFCGLLHSQQRFSVRAVPPDEFEAWIADQPGGG